METYSKVKKENGGEVLVRRGPAVQPSQVSTIPPQRAAFLAKYGNSGSKNADQCDSGFCDDEDIRHAEKQEAELDRFEAIQERESEQERMRTLAEQTRNLRIDPPQATDSPAYRQPCSNELDRTEPQLPVGGHVMNYAERNDPKYLLAPVREQLFVQDEDGDTSLHLAVIHAQQKVVDAIVSVVPCKECLDIFNDLRQSPLHLAVITRQPAVVRRLLEAGANVDLRDRNGKNALHLACERGDTDCVQEITRPLFEKPSYNDDIRQNLQVMLEARDYQGFTALHRAVLSNCIPVVGHLAAIGADVNCQDGTSGRTPLHHAVEMANLGMTGFLIFQCKADVDSVTFDECTPLHTAAGRGMESLVAMLLAAGADPTVANYEGESAQDHAMEEVAEMLER